MFYQIEHSSTSSGRRVNTTKRRVRWQWGIANKDALATGATGSRCRGREHEITLDWSGTSRKRLILLDGEEAHFSTGRRSERKFQYSWVAPGIGHHVFTVIAHAVAPLLQKTNQFDLLIDGQSCSKFPHLNEIGMYKPPSPEDVLYGTVVPDQHNHFAHQVMPDQYNHFAHQVRNTEHARAMNQSGLAPTRRPFSLCSPVSMNGMTQAVSLRRKSVAFSSDIAHLDLLSGVLSVQTNHNSSTYENESNAVLYSKPTELSPYGNNLIETTDGYHSRDTYGNKENPALFQNPARSTHRSSGFLSTLARKIHNKSSSSKNLQVQTYNTHYETGLIIDRY